MWNNLLRFNILENNLTTHVQEDMDFTDVFESPTLLDAAMISDSEIIPNELNFSEHEKETRQSSEKPVLKRFSDDISKMSNDESKNDNGKIKENLKENVYNKTSRGRAKMLSYAQSDDDEDLVVHEPKPKKKTAKKNVKNDNKHKKDIVVPSKISKKRTSSSGSGKVLTIQDFGFDVTVEDFETSKIASEPKVVEKVTEKEKNVFIKPMLPAPKQKKV